MTTTGSSSSKSRLVRPPPSRRQVRRVGGASGDATMRAGRPRAERRARTPVQQGSPEWPNNTCMGLILKSHQAPGSRRARYHHDFPRRIILTPVEVSFSHVRGGPSIVVQAMKADVRSYTFQIG